MRNFPLDSEFKKLSRGGKRYSFITLLEYIFETQFSYLKQKWDKMNFTSNCPLKTFYNLGTLLGEKVQFQVVLYFRHPRYYITQYRP